ncbi:hypothetical protein RUM44_006845 [Polyplax serrata]|uniref:Uncharacterized protein n=1 Tax=Polyplax serrata TaxID=468196 RepID=A0ABR1AJ69_POLSC
MLKIHRDSITSNLAALVEETNLNSLLPELLSRNVFNDRMIIRIMNPSHNTKRQKNDLYTEILKRGPHAFANLQSALESSGHLLLAQLLRDTEMKLRSDETLSSNAGHSNSSQFPVVNNLDSMSIDSREVDHEEMTSCRECAGIKSASSASNDQNTNCNNKNQDSGITNDLNNLSFETQKDLSCKMYRYPEYMKKWDKDFEFGEFPYTSNVIVCSNERFLPVKVKCSSNFKEQNHPGPPVYKMDSNPRGVALVVNNINFGDSEEFKTRYGADNDEFRLTKLLEQLHYDVEVHRNKTKLQMVDIVNKFSQRDELQEADSIIVTFMSHGEEGDTEDNSKIVGIDGMGLAINDIVSFFHNDACKALIGKPKVFFFQACRGVLEDPGVLLSRYFIHRRIENDGRAVRFPSIQNRIRSQSDIFIAFPVPPGRKANRDRITGTWFIQAIIDIFSEHAWNTHLEDMMKMVDLRIKNTNNLYTSNFQSLTTKTIGWNKNLYFNPGLARDKRTGEVILLGNNKEEACANSEEKDVTDSPTDSKRPCPSSPINNYAKLKEDQDNESERNAGKGCYNFLGCNAI